MIYFVSTKLIQMGIWLHHTSIRKFKSTESRIASKRVTVSGIGAVPKAKNFATLI